MQSVADTLKQAIASHQGQHLEEAERLYHAVLQDRPEHIDALHLLGVLYCQTGRDGIGIESLRRVITIAPALVPPRVNLAFALVRAGRFAEGAEQSREAIRIAPENPDAHNNLGLSMLGLNRLEDAAASFQQVLRLRPNDKAAQENLALTQRGAAPPPPPVPTLSAGDWNDSGNQFFVESRFDEAAESYRKAHLLMPDEPQILHNLGLALKRAGRAEEAAASFSEAVTQNSEFAPSHHELGIVLAERGWLEEAVEAHQKAVTLRPDDADFVLHLGLVQLDLGLFEDAERHFRKAIALRPDFARAHNSLGLALTKLHRISGAVRACDRALELLPDFAEAHLNRALAWLVSGDFERGFPEFEWRWKCNLLPDPKYPRPRWDGSPLNGKTILLHPEQGLGDTLQFIRYAPLVKQMGGRVIATCTKVLVPIVSSCPGIDALFAPGEVLPHFDVQASLLNLPALFGTRVSSVPADVPYLAAPADREAHWKAELGAHTGLRVGIAWQGSPAHASDRLRSAPLAAFAPLLSVPDVHMVSLQKGPGTDQLATFAGRNQIIDVGGKLAADFGDTAAAMRQLDLVITVDTAIAHLAGALAIPVWLALPYAPDWRWLLGRDDSPWYPTMRLFRQRWSGDWDDVFARIADALRVHA